MLRRFSLLTREPSTREPAACGVLSQQEMGRNPLDSGVPWLQ